MDQAVWSAKFYDRAAGKGRFVWHAQAQTLKNLVWTSDVRTQYLPQFIGSVFA